MFKNYHVVWEVCKLHRSAKARLEVVLFSHQKHIFLHTYKHFTCAFEYITRHFTFRACIFMRLQAFKQIFIQSLSLDSLFLSLRSTKIVCQKSTNFLNRRIGFASPAFHLSELQWLPKQQMPALVLFITSFYRNFHDTVVSQRLHETCWWSHRKVFKGRFEN